MKHLNRITELALCRAVPDMTIGKKMKPGRLKNLYSKLQKEVDRDLARLPRPTDSDIKKIESRIQAFGEQTGWIGKERHIGTLLSFCAEILENSEYPHNPKIISVINLIIEHLEAGGDLKTACCWAGTLAGRKWAMLMEELHA